jgi:hypothetical protein
MRKRRLGAMQICGTGRQGDLAMALVSGNELPAKALKAAGVDTIALMVIVGRDKRSCLRPYHPIGEAI